MKLTAFSLLLCAALLTGVQAQAAPVSLINAGFEENWTTQNGVGSNGYVTFYYGPSGPNVGWTFNSGAGVAENYNTFTAYQGSRFGLLQVGNPADPFGTSGSYLSQSFSLDSAAAVDISFALALRPGYAPGQTIAVALDGQVLNTFVANFGWEVKTLSLGAMTSGSHVLSFAGTADLAHYGDTTAFLDAVQLNTVPMSTSPVPEPETFALMLAGLGLIATKARRYHKS